MLTSWNAPGPATSLLPAFGDDLGFIPIRSAGLLAIEFAAERAGYVDDASAPFPPAPPFFEFS
jgi:hypothetical protein